MSRSPSSRSTTLLRRVFLVLPCLALLAGTSAASWAKPPNVVLIISDDQAWSDYGFMGHPHIETPNIDRLARQSRTFTRGYVPDSLCRPSLMTIVTGLYPHQHGVVGNDPPPPDDLSDAAKRAARNDPRYLDIRNEYLKHIDDDDTLAEMLGRAGYVSHQSGKWWEGHYSRGGFTEGMTHGDRTRGGRHGDEGLDIGREGMEPVFDFIDRATDEGKPFFVYYAPFLPHTPHNPPADLLAKYEKLTPHLPIAKYWAMCEWFDQTVGQLMGHLDDRGIAEETLVLYCCDNGWINDPHESRYMERSKRSQYEGGIRIPIMVRWTGHVQPEMDTENLASTIDLVPTALDAAGLDLPRSLPGISLLDKAAVRERDAIYGEIFEHDIQSMDDPVASLRFRWIIQGDWKLIVPHPGREPKALIELYNVRLDPTEENEVSASHPEIVERLKKKLNAWWNPAGSR